MHKKIGLLIFSVLFLLAPSCTHVPSSKDSSQFFQEENLYNSIVKIKNSLELEICDISNQGEIQDCQEKTFKFSSGSGFAISRDLKYTKNIGTAGHICKLSERQKARIQISILLQKGKWAKNINIHDFTVIHDNGIKRNAHLLDVDRTLDACILHVPNKTFPALHIAKSPPKRGVRYYSAGAPLGLNGEEMTYLTAGLYSGSKELRGKEMDVFSLPSTFGSSGSAILNHKGKVVGLISLGIPRFKEVSISPDFDSLHHFFTTNLPSHR